AVVAQERGKVAAIVGNNVDIPVIIVVGGGQTTADNRTHEIGPDRLRYFFKAAFAQIAKHEQRFFVGNLILIECDIIEHGAVGLQNIVPAVVVVVQEFHG